MDSTFFILKKKGKNERLLTFMLEMLPIRNGFSVFKVLCLLVQANVLTGTGTAAREHHSPPPPCSSKEHERSHQNEAGLQPKACLTQRLGLFFQRKLQPVLYEAG